MKGIGKTEGDSDKGPCRQLIVAGVIITAAAIAVALECFFQGRP